MAAAAYRYLRELRVMQHGITGSADFRPGDVTCTDKFGREVRFTPAPDIPHHLSALMGVFADEYAAAADRLGLSACLAKFYYGFIAIHPFMDGNRRTAFAFLENRARDKGYAIEMIELLQKVLLEGDVPAEMRKLTALFEHMLKPASVTAAA